MTTKRFIVALLMVASSAWAGQLEDADSAFERKDYATALRIWRPMAAQGNGWAQFKLGWMYSNGQGVVQDYAEAVNWYRLAAAQGQFLAQSNLGFMYVAGRGVREDVVLSHMWFSLAAMNGETNAVKLRDLSESNMTPKQLGEAQKLARECLARNFKACN